RATWIMAPGSARRSFARMTPTRSAPSRSNAATVWSISSLRCATNIDGAPLPSADITIAAAVRVFPPPVGRTSNGRRFPARNSARTSSIASDWYGRSEIVMPTTTPTPTPTPTATANTNTTAPPPPPPPATTPAHVACDLYAPDPPSDPDHDHDPDHDP